MTSTRYVAAAVAVVVGVFSLAGAARAQQAPVPAVPAVPSTAAASSAPAGGNTLAVPGAEIDPVACLASAAAKRAGEGQPSAVLIDKDACAKLVDAVERETIDAVRRTALDALTGALSSGGGSTFLRDLNLKPKLVDNGKGDTSLAFSYDYKKDIGLVLTPTANGQKGTGWNLSLSGTFAADKDVNPENFINSSFAFSMIRESGGAAAANHLFSDEYARQLAQFDIDAAKITDPDELMKHPATTELRRIQSMLGSQLYTALDVRAGLEANQSFSQKSYVYGLQLGVDYKSLSTESIAARANVLDYPFALIRYLTGYPGADGFSPSGVSFPTLLIGLDQVDPEGNDPRAVLGEKGSYGRARAELTFRTPLLQTAEGTYKVTADARYYKELSASPAVKAAGLDERFYVTAAIVAPNGVFVSYRSGDLPFDIKSQVVYELGFHTYFK
ncbi:MAG: hypothetical protein WDO68_21405 [Gammaproteobacteria bacterium]